MDPIRILLPKEFILEPGAIRRIGEVASGLGRRAFVLIRSIPGMEESDTLPGLVGEDLASAGVEMVSGRPGAAEPTVEDADENARLCRQSDCDLVISIGGGSVMDLGKAVAMLRHNPGPARDYQMGERQIEHPVLPHIAAPTTSGTGSEASRVSPLRNEQLRIKKSIIHEDMVPTTALLDPLLTVSMPPRLTALTGIDALSHAVESFVSPAANPFTEACGLRAIELIGRSLRQAVRDGSDVEARSNMAMASYLGGVSLNGGVGAAHILGQPLGAYPGIAHGLAIAILLPHVVQVNWQHRVGKYAAITRALDGAAAGAADEDAARTCSELLCRLFADIGVSDTLGSHGVSRADFDRILDIVARSTAHIKTNPRPVTQELLVEILERAL